MQRMMLTLDGWLADRRRLIVALWMIALFVAAPFALRQSDHLTGGGFTAPGSASDRVYSAIARDFPAVSAEPLSVVLVPSSHSSAQRARAASAYVEREVSAVHDVTLSRQRSAPRAADPAPAPAPASNHEPLLLPLTVNGGEQADIDIAGKLRHRFGITTHALGLAPGGYHVALVGQGALWAAFQDDAKRGSEIGEARGFPVIGLVLLAVFGSLAALALPLGLGAVAVTVTGAVIYALSLALHMSIFVTNMASMLGLGVAVDYSLFVLARYREEIAAGASRQDARATALATSGSAVVFSALTVVASLTGLFLTDSAALRSMAAGAIIVVVVSMLAAATLLPVLIGLLGERVDRPNPTFRRLGARFRREARPSFWERWTNAVMRHPVLSVLAALAVMLALAAPALQLKMGNDALRQVPSGDSTLTAMAAAAAVTGPGALGPVYVVVTPRADAPAAGGGVLRRLTEAVSVDPDVARVQQPSLARGGHSALISVLLRARPDSDVARRALSRLRLRLPHVAGRSAQVEIGGTTATLLDFDQLISSSLVKIMLFVLALSFVVLMVLLRSLILPLKAVLMNVLSVGAAYGVTVAVFQWGWLDFLGLQRTPYIDTITPPLVLAIAFGLSMDYEVFLLTRIRERYLATGDNRSAVAQGLSTSARTITSAALIMVAVFLAFVSAGLPSLQRLGLACAAAIALDATIVRLVLVPAAMELLGRWNWWLPSTLARVLPPVELENSPSAAVRPDVVPGRRSARPDRRRVAPTG